MIRTLSQFNGARTDEAFDDDALRKGFYASGHPEIDALWSEPHQLLRDREALATKLSLTAERAGVGAQADFVFALIQRLPYVLRGIALSHCQTARLISRCVRSLTSDSSIGSPLRTALGPIAQVLEWHRRHITFDDRASQRTIFVVITLATFIFYESKRFGLEGAKRQAVQNLYDVLEETLDACHPHQESWFELHSYCASALGHDLLSSKAYASAQNVPELTARYKRVVAKEIGQPLADILFMRDRAALRALVHETTDEQRPALLVQLVKARSYYPSELARHGKPDPWSMLCVSLCPSTNWNELFDYARQESKKPLAPSDADMAELVKALAEDGCLESESILKRALELCRDGHCPKTYAALSNYRNAEHEESPEDYPELRGWLAQRMLLLKAVRFLRRGPTSGA
jgi:hypothetical protein